MTAKRGLVPIVSCALASLLLAASGCGSIPVEPFEQFSISMLELSEGSDKALADLVPVSEARFKRELIELLESESDDDAILEQIQRLRLSADKDNPFESAPLFLQIERMRTGASQATQSFVGYSQLLLQLVDSELLPQSRFEQLARDLNGHAFSAATTLGGAQSASTQESIALFSTAAIALTRGYLESKRRKELQAALEANQGNIELFARTMQTATATIHRLSLNEYDVEFGELMGQLGSIESRNKAVDDLVLLTRAHARQLETLRALHSAYGKLGAAHRELARAVVDSRQGLSAIISVLESGKQLQSAYDEALTANKSTAVQAEADKALAQADASEAEAQLVALQAATARAVAEQARIDAAADPGDDAKQQRATQLDSAANMAEEEAATARANAEALRATADSVQEQANEIKRRLKASSQ